MADRAKYLCAYRPLCHLPFTPVHCRARLQWCLNQSDWNHADWGRIVFSDKSRFQLCLDDHRKVSGDVQDSVPNLLSLLHATQALSQKLWTGVSFLCTAGPVWSSLESTCSTAIRRLHSENCFVAVPLAAPRAYFSAR
ncbi:hypothetical protein TNCV_5063701 [Trichonephila clavipes]|nr:hypothetical protein TNCV_5063701 [Trichonephila clavipes]